MLNAVLEELLNELESTFASTVDALEQLHASEPQDFLLAPRCTERAHAN